MARGFSVRVFFLIQMEAEAEGEFVQESIAVEAGIAGAGEDTHETFLTVFFALKSVTGASHK